MFRCCCCCWFWCGNVFSIVCFCLFVVCVCCVLCVVCFCVVCFCVVVVLCCCCAVLLLCCVCVVGVFRAPPPDPPSDGPPSAGPPSAGPPCAGPPSAGPPSAGPPKISLFFFRLPPQFSILFSLSCWSFSLNFGGVFEDRDPQMCTFGLSGCRVKPRPPGLAHDSPRTPNVHI